MTAKRGGPVVGQESVAFALELGPWLGAGAWLAVPVVDVLVQQGAQWLALGFTRRREQDEGLDGQGGGPLSLTVPHHWSGP